MQEIIIRTNYSNKVGLGHLFRTKTLANKFDKKKYKITYALDHKIKNKKLLDFDYFSLYPKNKNFTNQVEDAQILKKKIKEKNIKYIILDDYRFDKTWEKFFYKKKILIVFDDICNKKHLCDFLINSRWTDINLLEQKYKKLVPKACKKLLGPNYSVINPNLKKKINKSKKINLMFYFGGGGDFRNYNKFIINFCSQVKNYKFENMISVNVVIGPLAINYEKLRILTKKNKFVNLLQNNLDLSSALKKTSIYFGTASSIVNELNYLNIPSCIFSTSRNQENDFKYREDLGHFLFFKKRELSNTKQVVKFLIILIKKYKRFKRLCNKKKVFIDINGTERIIKALNNKKYLKNKIKKNIFSKIKNKKIGKVEDTFINKYLDSRNLEQNRKNSLNTNLINKIDHYIWWFSTRRQSYYLQRNGKIRIFFSQELVNFKKRIFWVGGWFNSKNKCTTLDIMEALKWQLNYSKKIHNCPWIVLIKKTNKIVFKINRYLGYKIISKNKNNILYQALRDFYNIKKTKNYYFLEK